MDRVAAARARGVPRTAAWDYLGFAANLEHIADPGIDAAKIPHRRRPEVAHVDLTRWGLAAG